MIGTPQRAGLRRGARRPAAVDPLRDAVATPALVQPVAAAPRPAHRADRPRRPAVPVVGGRAAVPRPVPAAAAARRGRRARAPHGRLGRRPAAVQPGHQPPAGGRAARRDRPRRAAQRARTGTSSPTTSSPACRTSCSCSSSRRRRSSGSPRRSATTCSASSGSGRTLAELERLQLVTSSLEGHGTFRSHEVLRAHLDALLIEWEGARRRCASATGGRPSVLEQHGHFAEALRANCRGEDWPSASRLLGSRGAEVADRPGPLARRPAAEDGARRSVAAARRSPAASAPTGGWTRRSPATQRVESLLADARCR